MKKRLSIIYLFLFSLLPLSAQTLQECQQAAEQNYPLIRQYDLISRTTDLTVANIGKGWLPQVSAQAQATWQSDVVSWPEQMQAVYQQMGLDMKGLKKDQYRVGLDISQTVYDGGTISSRKAIARQQGAVEAAQTEVTVYQLHQRVNEMYFGLLLLEEQIRLNHNLQQLLESNEKKLQSMYEKGTAAESDYQSIRAERLNIRQQGVDLQARQRSLFTLLSTFCGIEVKTVEKPTLPTAQTTLPATLRPELKAIDAQLKLADAHERALNAELMPRLSVFATGFYGYPGYNMFADMMKHEWSLNGMIGTRLTWNIGALYTHKNNKAKLQLQRDMAETSRDVFLFNNRLEQMQENENIARYRRLMGDDAEIISLRTAVRQTAESKLAHGIIDVNDLLKEINAENVAKTQQTVHEIEMLKEIYNLKHTINN